MTRREFRDWVQTMTTAERRDLRAVRLMLRGHTPTQAAAKIGVTAKTLYHRGLVAKARNAMQAQAQAQPETVKT